MKQYINKIKWFRNAALILSVLVLSVSCEDILDEQPISEISPANFWQNNSDALAGIIGVYDGMQPAYRQNHFLWGDFRSDSHRLSESGAASLDVIELVQQNITPGNQTVLRWDDLYELINRANQAIKYIPTIPNYDENLLAEAYALRAFSYFNAIRVWGAVPLNTEPTESILDLQKQRTPAATILNDVIIPDMLKAEELMAIPNSKFRFSEASILCLQAEVYMWEKEYDKAKVALDKMMALGGYSLVTSVQAWEDLFYNTPQSPDTPDGRGKIQTGPELIFSIRFDLAEVQGNPGPGNGIDNRSGVFGLYFAGIPSVNISKTLEAKWQERFPIDSIGWVTKYPNVAPAVTLPTGTVYGDWRYFLSREGGYENNIPNARIAKWAKSNFSPAFDDTDIVIYRYAGMLLLLAEAENQINEDGVRALELVNQLRTARKLPNVTMEEFGATKEEREDYILDERQFELLGEGKRWWDLRRTDKALEVLNPILDSLGSPPLTTDRLLFPIYFEHLVENPNLLPQNTGY